ncbi:hypothetical protein M5K25_025483 [Dendrobium thyrsiflorum]|uniref:Uncharacterized protein n=1 Tax=Dendrobium thyrsiflorum TaxID=117978 RepID=A0ABD0U475_DENTH
MEEEEEEGRRAREEAKAAVDGMRRMVTDSRPAAKGWRTRRLANSMKIITIGHESRSKIKLETSEIKFGIIRTPISANL